MDRADSLSGIAKHLERRVSDYITTNIHITSSGMLQERLLRHALDFTGADRVLFSTDYPFHRPGAAAVETSSTPSPAPQTALRSLPATRRPCSGWPDASPDSARTTKTGSDIARRGQVVHIEPCGTVMRRPR